MSYKVRMTSHSKTLIDHALDYIINTLKNPSAAGSILQEIENAVASLEESPFQYTECENKYLRLKEYRKIKLNKHDYVLIFKVRKTEVIIYGFFHTSENYSVK